MLDFQPFSRTGAAALLAFALVASCDRPPATPSEVPLEVQLAREMAAAHFASGNNGKTREALAPLVAKSDAAFEDLVAAAIVELNVAELPKAKLLLERASKRAPDDPTVLFNLARLDVLQTDFKSAAARLERVLALVPDDAPSKLHLADALRDSDPARARQLLREVIAGGVDHQGPWYTSAVFKLANDLVRDDATLDEGARLHAEFQELDGRGVKPPQGNDYDMGNLGRIRAPAPRGNRPGAGRLPSFAASQTILPEFAGASRVLASDLDNDGLLDLVGCGPKGLAIGLQRAGSAWEGQVLVAEPTDIVLAYDLGNDDDIDLLYARGNELHLLEAFKDGTPPQIAWRVWPGKLPALASPPRDMLALDYDHEGDLDLLLAGDFGALLLRDDGAAIPDKGAYTDVTAEAGLPRARKFACCVTEDFDTDQDVDVLLGGPDGAFLASNLRGGRFEDRSSAASLAGADLTNEPLVADVDGDARPDVLAGGAVWLGNPSGEFTRTEQTAHGRFAIDFDLDGALDVLDVHDGKLTGRLAVGLEPMRDLTADIAAPASLALIDDLDGDLAWDLVAVSTDGLVVQRGSQPGASAVRLGFRGRKDNRRALGAIVELRAGPIYRRIYWRGEIQLAGVGGQSELDLIRVTWPNGVVQHDTNRALGDRVASGDDPLGLLQSDKIGGSCPFLYTWNGATYVFVTDVLGITPLGLPMAPGMLVPPDHDEYVLVRGDQLQAHDGFYEMHFTEELREVTYLDRIRLDVVDSPVGVEIYPNELFTFPPFPVAHTHTVRAPLAPIRAVGSDGADWKRALSADDGEYSAPFEVVEHQFPGLASPHWLELEFDLETLARASKLRLVLTGWFYWTDASVNLAAARDPVQEFVPPILQLPDGAGGWKDAGPPIGFPAGKTKSMVVDVTGLLRRDDPRLRLFSTLRLYWDSIRLAVDDDDAELVTRSLEPASAQLWRRGFSAHEDSSAPHQPERFEWDQLAQFPRWNQHPGLYTKYGETLPLLTAIDDRFVILGAGDALTVKFDARALPPPREDFKRDYLVFLDGWAKDRDPNTLEALYVEPLPFHGMSGYPYRADEQFPDDEAHRAWRREWNTRAPQAWLEPLTIAR